MASGMMVPRIPGFIRSIVLLAAIGAAGSGVSAAFQTADALPSTVLNLLASGVFDAALAPQIVGALKRRYDGETYVNHLFTLAGTLLFIVTILSMIAASLFVVITAAGYDSEIRTLVIPFALLYLPQLFSYGLYSLLSELFNTCRAFGPYMRAPVVNNLVGTAGLGAFPTTRDSSEGRTEVTDFTSARSWLLGGSMILDVITQTLILLVPVKHAGIRFTPDFHFHDTHFDFTSKVAGWALATLGANQVGVLSMSNLAAFADAYVKTHGGVFAGISAYATAFMILILSQSPITVSLMTTILTRIVEAMAGGDGRGVAVQYMMGIRMITSLALLAVAVLIMGLVSMTRMVLSSYSNQEIIAEYAWILAALMSGVVSIGMVLMSQRVFFAYEDVKPVFPMSIDPAITQVIVDWGMYLTTGATRWVVGAVLGEIACRLVQGVIAVTRVSKRNAFVDKASLLRSYSPFFASAPIVGLLASGTLWAVGIHTIVESTSAYVSITTGKILLVTLIASFGYLIALRFIAPGESARTIAPLLVRFEIPNGVCILLAAPLQASPRKVEDNG